MVLETVLGPPPNLYVENLTPRMIEYGKRALKELIKVKWHRKGGVLIQQDQCP